MRRGVAPSRLTERRLRALFIAAAVLYVVVPRDLIPGFSLISQIDDALVVGYLFWQYRRLAQRLYGARTEQNPGGASGKESANNKTQDANNLDPYQVLGVAKSASQEEIRQAYRALAAQYHPDKVAHLGEDLRALAHRKMLDIQRAYQELSH